MRADVAARLAAIGPYITEPGEGPDADEYNYVWERLPELRCGWADFDLVFSVPSDSDRAPDEKMFELWEWYRRGHRQYAQEFREEIIARSLGADYDPEKPVPERSDEEVRRLVGGATIRVFWQTAWPDEYSHGVDACFKFTFFDHGMVRTWDEETQRWDYTY